MCHTDFWSSFHLTSKHKTKDPEVVLIGKSTWGICKLSDYVSWEHRTVYVFLLYLNRKKSQFSLLSLDICFDWFISFAVGKVSFTKVISKSNCYLNHSSYATTSYKFSDFIIISIVCLSTSNDKLFPNALIVSLHWCWVPMHVYQVLLLMLKRHLPRSIIKFNTYCRILKCFP